MELSISLTTWLVSSICLVEKVTPILGVIYWVAGIGALYVRRRPRVRVEPVQSGGGQERNIRSGTVPAPLCVGLGEACRLAMQEKEVSISNHVMEYKNLVLSRYVIWLLFICPPIFQYPQEQLKNNYESCLISFHRNILGYFCSLVISLGGGFVIKSFC